ncbi:MAG: PEP-CTERM sorting domain-containing protein [Chromatiales bacterium]|nr:PEP-CTERM sorting domain-containing protein [Chromatiales bacterium]
MRNPLTTRLRLGDAAAALALAAPGLAGAVPISLTASGNIVAGLGESYFSGQLVADGTPFTVTFTFDTDAFSAGVVGPDGITYYNINASGVGPGCTGGFAPGLPDLIASQSTLNSSTLQAQSSGNVTNCDYIGMRDLAPEFTHVLQIGQFAYNTDRAHFTDGELTTPSATETPYFIQETRIDRTQVSGLVANEPFSPDLLLTELAQTFTFHNVYGMLFVAEFQRGRYICSTINPGLEGQYSCVNEPAAPGSQYFLNGIVNGMSGTVVPAPGTLGLLLTAVAGAAGIARRKAKSHRRRGPSPRSHDNKTKLRADSSWRPEAVAGKRGTTMIGSAAARVQ